MNGSGALLDMWQAALHTLVMAGAPFVLVALSVGLLVSIFQAATQLQENILSFVPKLVAIGFVLAIGGTWVLGKLVGYQEQVAQKVESVGRGER